MNSVFLSNFQNGYNRCLFLVCLLISGIEFRLRLYFLIFYRYHKFPSNILPLRPLSGCSHDFLCLTQWSFVRRNCIKKPRFPVNFVYTFSRNRKETNGFSSHNNYIYVFQIEREKGRSFVIHLRGNVGNSRISDVVSVDSSEVIKGVFKWKGVEGRKPSEFDESTQDCEEILNNEKQLLVYSTLRFRDVDQ